MLTFCTSKKDLKETLPLVFGDGAAENLNGKQDLNSLFSEQVWGKNFGNFFYVPGKEAFAAINIGDKRNPKTMRSAVARAWKEMRAKSLTRFSIDLRSFSLEEQKAIVEGLWMSDYAFVSLKSDPDSLPARIEEVLLLTDKKNKPELERAQVIVQGTLRARDLCQMPPNLLDPEHFASIAADFGEAFGFKTKCLNQAQMEALGMESLLSVSAGSVKPPKLIIMDYNPKGAKKTFVFVGKAVTFDSGGLSLKPSTGMPEMKGDMGGGATVLGLMTVLKEAGCPIRVIGLIPAVENMPSGSATRPSDVVKSLSGLTIEINNTDAEGRLILADALTYAQRFNPDYVVDFATLTGACIVALGPKLCGIMGNNKALISAFIEAGLALDEPYWELPLFDEYDEMLKSQTADVANVAGSRYGGAILAGLFLRRFAKDYQWAHCDIAPSLNEKPNDLAPAGGIGFGVRTAMAVLDKYS